jgi:hypothetical protein
MGARTVRQAAAESGLSRDAIWNLMNDGTLPWFAHDGKGTRLVAWKAIVELLDREHREYTAQQNSAPKPKPKAKK